MMKVNCSHLSLMAAAVILAACAAKNPLPVPSQQTEAAPAAAPMPAPAGVQSQIKVQYSCLGAGNQKHIVAVTYNTSGSELTSALLDVDKNGNRVLLKRNMTTPNSATQNIYSDYGLSWVTDSATAANVQTAGGNMLQKDNGEILLKYCEVKP